MIGLVRKDLLIMVRSFSLIQLLPLTAPLVVIIQYKEFFMPIIVILITFLLALQVTTTMSLDETANWRKYVTAMPISTFYEACSKYILVIVLSILSSSFVYIIGATAGIAYFSMNHNMIITYTIISFTVSILYNAFLIPLSYKFGTAKSRYFVMFFVLIPVIVPYFFNIIGVTYNINTSDFIGNAWFIIKLILFEIIILFISMFISIKILNMLK